MNKFLSVVLCSLVTLAGSCAPFSSRSFSEKLSRSVGMIEIVRVVEVPFLTAEGKTEVQRLDVQEQMEEFMFLGLRLTEGISKKDFYSAFNRDIHEIYGGVIDKLQKQELIAVSERVKLTDYGRDISNYVMAQFLF